MTVSGGRRRYGLRLGWIPYVVSLGGVVASLAFDVVLGRGLWDALLLLPLRVWGGAWVIGIGIARPVRTGENRVTSHLAHPADGSPY